MRRTAFSPARSRLATLTAVATTLLLAAGASVTSTGSGLAVPDWPLSFGSAFPRMTGGVVFEHGHRMIAAVVAALIAILAVVTIRGESRPWVQRWSLVALGMVVLQAVLGGLTVLLKLPSAVSVAHAGLAQGVLAVVTMLAVVSSRRWAAHTPSRDDPRIGRAALVVTTLVYVQILLGAVVRHTGSGLVFADFPLSGGRIVPAFTHPSMAIQFAHRAGAVVVTLAVIGLVTMAHRARDASRRVRGLSLHAAAVVAVQIALGATSVWTRLAPAVTIAHVVCGALLLASMLTLTLWCFHAALTADAEWAEDRARPLRVASR